MIEPSDLTPRQAQKNFLSKRKASSSDWTIRTYRYQLNEFVHFLEENGIETIGEVNGWVIDQYERKRRQEVKPATVRGDMVAVKQLIDYCVTIEAVDPTLPERIDVPTLSKEDGSSSDRLETKDAIELLDFFRNSTAYYGKPMHAVLEIFWCVGCRLGGLQALDLKDYIEDGPYLHFKNRTGTRLKNASDGERPVQISPQVADVLDTYIARERWDVRDDRSREPLFTSRRGRASKTTIRNWTYTATFPCWFRSCPHGEVPSTCEFKQVHRKQSQCPSSKGPHAIRTGSITWQLNRGIPIEVVSERVNASPDTIKRHYDKEEPFEELEQRRSQWVHDLDIDKENESLGA